MLKAHCAKKKLVTRLCNQWIPLARDALKRPLVKQAFDVTGVSKAFAPDALAAAQAFVQAHSTMPEFYVGQGALRGQPEFAEGDDISPILWNFTIVQLKAKLQAFRADGVEVRSISGKKADLVARVKACMGVRAPAAAATAQDGDAPTADDDDSEWEDNTPNAPDDTLDAVIADQGEGVEDPEFKDEDDEFNRAMYDGLDGGQEQEQEDDNDDGEEGGDDDYDDGQGGDD